MSQMLSGDISVISDKIVMKMITREVNSSTSLPNSHFDTFNVHSFSFHSFEVGKVNKSVYAPIILYELEKACGASGETRRARNGRDHNSKSTE